MTLEEWFEDLKHEAYKRGIDAESLNVFEWAEFWRDGYAASDAFDADDNGK